MLVNIKGVQVETIARDGLVYVNNISGEERFIYVGPKGRPVRMPPHTYAHYPVNRETGFEVLTPAEVQELDRRNSPFFLMQTIKKLRTW